MADLWSRLRQWLSRKFASLDSLLAENGFEPLSRPGRVVAATATLFWLAVAVYVNTSTGDDGIGTFFMLLYGAFSLFLIAGADTLAKRAWRTPHAQLSVAGLVWGRYGHALPDELARAGATLGAWRTANA